MVEREVPSHHNAYEPSRPLDPDIALGKDVEHIGGDRVGVGNVTSETNNEVAVKYNIIIGDSDVLIEHLKSTPLTHFSSPLPTPTRS